MSTAHMPQVPSYASAAPARRWGRKARLLFIAMLVLLPLAAGVVYLSDNPPRDWSLHWVTPRTMIPAMSDGLYDAVDTPRGWDVIWTSTSGQLSLSHFNSDGGRIAADVHLGRSPMAATLGRAGSTDVAAWREDYNGGSRLRIALIAPGQAPVYHTIASGSAPLEHPYAFSAGTGVDIVFSWQRHEYDVYLIRIGSSGTVHAPVQLTNVASYAFYPHAVVDTPGTLQLVYFNLCCFNNAFNLVAARFTAAGRPLAPARTLDTIYSIASTQGGSGSAPDSWGLDARVSGGRVWVVWSNDQGISQAQLRDGRVLGAGLVAPVPSPRILALAFAGDRRELVWPQAFDLGTNLTTLGLSAQGIPASEPDRIAFESAIDTLPFPVQHAGVPAVLWQATPQSGIARLEFSHYQAATIDAPNLATRLGLGLANPAGNVLLLLFGGLALGVLLALANLLLIAVMVGIFMILLRRLPGFSRWVVYVGLIALAMYLLLAVYGAPFPVLLLNSVSTTLGLVAAIGMFGFCLLLLQFLRRVDDVFRALILAVTGLWFIAFLQALQTIQAQLGKI